MKIWKFEGSPEEYNFVAHMMTDGNQVSAANHMSPQQTKATPVDSPSRGDRKFVTVAQAKEVLTRRELSAGMLNVLRELYDAGETRVRSDQLMKINGHTSDQFRGLMGAFGHRLVKTVNNKETWFLDDKWDHTISQNTYRLPPSVRTAIEEIGLL